MTDEECADCGHMHVCGVCYQPRPGANRNPLGSNCENPDCACKYDPTAVGGNGPKTIAKNDEERLLYLRALRREPCPTCGGSGFVPSQSLETRTGALAVSGATG